MKSVSMSLKRNGLCPTILPFTKLVEIIWDKITSSVDVLSTQDDFHQWMLSTQDDFHQWMLPTQDDFQQWILFTQDDFHQ